MLDSAYQCSATLEHVVFCGVPGLGKTTLTAIIAAGQAARFHELAAPSIQKPDELSDRNAPKLPLKLYALSFAHVIIAPL